MGWGRWRHPRCEVGDHADKSTCNAHRAPSTITASTHSMSRGMPCAWATRSLGVCRAATLPLATNSAEPCCRPTSALPRLPAARDKTVWRASDVLAARLRKLLRRSRRCRSWPWRLPTRPRSCSTCATVCALCSRAYRVPPPAPAHPHAGAEWSGSRARVRARVRVRLAPGGVRSSSGGQRRIHFHSPLPASPLPASRARTRTRARTRAREPTTGG
jgi:hypothetical protein